MSPKYGPKLAAGVAGLALLVAACGDDGVQDSVAEASEKVDEAAKDPSNSNVEEAEKAVVEADKKIGDRYQAIVASFNSKADALEAQAGDDYAKLNTSLSDLDGKVVTAAGLIGDQRTDAWNDVNDQVKDISSTASDMEASLDGDAKDAVTTLVADLTDLGKEIEAGLGLS